MFHFAKEFSKHSLLFIIFNSLYLQNLLNTLAFENKDIFLMGDFNINILQYDNGKNSLEFLDKINSNYTFPYLEELLLVYTH